MAFVDPSRFSNPLRRFARSLVPDGEPLVAAPLPLPESLADEPWYSVGPNDVFPEEFPRFLFADITQRRLFNQLHGDLYTAEYWQGLQEAIRAGKVIDVFPYRRKADLIA